MHAVIHQHSCGISVRLGDTADEAYHVAAELVLDNLGQVSRPSTRSDIIDMIQDKNFAAAIEIYNANNGGMPGGDPETITIEATIRQAVPTITFLLEKADHRRHDDYPDDDDGDDEIGEDDDWGHRRA